MMTEADPAQTRAVVWIVDDLRSEVASLTRLLSVDFDLAIFEDGPQMFERLKSAPPPDVLVIEQWLRGLTGVEICRVIRASPSMVGLPILLLTVPVDNDEILQGLSAGADDYLIKPFSPALLAARITSLIRVKRLRERAERAEEEARTERDRFVALIEQSGDGMIAADEHGTLRVFNQEARRQWGLGDDVHLEGGAWPFDLLTLEGLPMPREETPLHRAVRGERVEETRFQVRRPDGSIRALAGNASPLRHADGSPAGAVLSTRDETARLHLEEALRRSQAWLAMTLQSVGDALIATDEAGRVVFMNPVAVQLTGWTIDAAKGRPLEQILDIVNETTREPVENPVAKVLREGVVVGLANHTILRSRDGSEVAIDDSAAPIRDEQGKIFGVVLVFRDVSEARRKDNERRTFQAAVDASPDFIAFGDLNSRVEYVNPAGMRLVGLESREAARATPGADYFSLETRVARAAAVRVALAAGQAFHGNSELRHFETGASIPVSQTTFTVHDAEGRPLMLATVCRDRREQARAEAEREALLAREKRARAEAVAERQKLHDLFMQAPVAISILEGPEHTFTLANAAYRALVNGRDVVGKSLFEALPDVAGMGFDMLLDRVMATAEPFVANEVKVKLAHHAEGEALILNYVYAPKRDAEGRVDGVLMSGIDVTEQVRARDRAQALAAELLESEERVRRVVEASGAGLWDLDAATGQIDADARMVELMGFPPGSAFNLETGLDNLPVEDAERIGAAVAAALAGENEGRYLVEFRTGEKSGGPHRWVESRAQIAFDAEGKAERLAGAMIDITARKQAEAAQQSLLDEAERFREEVEKRTQFEQHLLGIVSHDLRNPLGAILLGATGLLEMAESEEVTQIAARIRSSAERSTRMISDLLDFTQARLGSGIRLERRSVDLYALAEATIREVELMYPDRTIELLQAGDTRGTWDADRLAQVIINLVTNALKYSLAETPVALRIAARNGMMELTVHNEGPPIPAERLGQLFEPLQRATEEIDFKTRSVGLGLYIVDAIVKAHGGTVGVVSTAEAGTTFKVRLPRDLHAMPQPQGAAP